jgi:hypothetical protein
VAEKEMSEEEFDDDEPFWESKARERVEEALEYVRFDEVRGVIYALSGEDHKLNRIEEEFQSYDDMVQQSPSPAYCTPSYSPSLSEISFPSVLSVIQACARAAPRTSDTNHESSGPWLRPRFCCPAAS